MNSRATPQRARRRYAAKRLLLSRRRPASVIWNGVNGAELNRAVRLRREYQRRKQVLHALYSNEVRVPFFAMLQADIRRAGSHEQWLRAPLLDAQYAVQLARQARDLAVPVLP